MRWREAFLADVVVVVHVHVRSVHWLQGAVEEEIERRARCKKEYVRCRDHGDHGNVYLSGLARLTLRLVVCTLRARRAWCVVDPTLDGNCYRLRKYTHSIEEGILTRVD